MKHEQNQIKKNLEEKFKQLLPSTITPKELKNDVFSTLDTYHLLADVIDLFTTKFSKTEAAFFNLLDNNEEDPTKSKEDLENQ